MRVRGLIGAVLVGVALVGCSGKPEGCVEIPKTDVVDLMKGDAIGLPSSAARLDADGGQYVAAVMDTAGGDVTAVWYIGNGGKGPYTSVGYETQLFSNFPLSTTIGIPISSDAARDARKCVED